MRINLITFSLFRVVLSELLFGLISSLLAMLAKMLANKDHILKAFKVFVYNKDTCQIVFRWERNQYSNFQKVVLIFF